MDVLSLQKSSTVYRTFLKCIALWIGALHLIGCAGPTSPLGPIELSELVKSAFQKAQHAFIKDESVSIQFETTSQFYLNSGDLRISVRDDKGIPETARIAILYNGREVTQNFTMPEADDGQYSKAFVYKNLRFPASTLNEVEVMYFRDIADSKGVAALLPRPKCHWNERQPLETLGHFQTSPDVLRVIEEAAFDHSFNPAFLAAIVAQESGFNPRAVSTYRAIGLTQMTHMAESDILERAKQWPRYPGIRELSYVELKFKILTRKIHDANEWRLNPALSVMGGSLYLQHLQDYWMRPNKIALASQSGSDIGDIILASYNIGPAAVSRSIERGGLDWLKDREGRRAVKYVNMVGSYCEAFSKGDT
jgi:hypothetical protein